MYARLSAWVTVATWAHQQYPNANSLSLHPEHKFSLSEMLALMSDASRYLRKLAYPDARDLEPNPDSLLNYKRERRRARWKRLPGFKDR